MARAINRLTDKAVKALKEPGRYADGDGLYLVIDSEGRKRWIVFFPWRGRRREMGLGNLASVSLAEARAAAQDAKDKASKNIDPIAERKAPAPIDTPTLKDFAEELIKSLEKGWTGAKTADGWRRSFVLHAKAIGGRRVDDIDTAAVLQVLKPLWSAKPESAGKLRERLELVLDSAKAQGLIASPWENPARWRGHLALMLPKRSRQTGSHFPAMPYALVPSLLIRLAQSDGMSARALEWTIFTAARESMTLGACFGEIERAEMIWTVPAERMKNRKPFRVPITPPMLDVLARCWPEVLGEPKPDQLIFPGRGHGKQLSNGAMDMMMRDLAPPFVPHGFRSSFRTWVDEQTEYPGELAEMALAHVVGSAVERAYRRGDALDKRRTVMLAWAGFCTGRAVGNVVPMRSA